MTTPSPLPAKLDLEDTQFRAILTDLIRNTELQTPVQSLFTIGTQSGNDIIIDVQFRNSAGEPLGFLYSTYIYLSDNSDGSSIVATAPSGGLAATTGLFDVMTTDKSGIIVTDIAGLCQLTLTEAGVDTFYLCVRQPNNRVLVSQAISFT